MTNDRIQEILDKAKLNSACSSNYNKAETAFKQGDINLCLETFLGNIDWLEDKNICTINEIPDYITEGKIWHDNGNLKFRISYKNKIEIEYH